MRLGDFLAAPSARMAPTKPVKFKVLGKSVADGQALVADVDAVFAFVDEQGRQEAKRDAREELKKLYPSGTWTDSDFAEELTYQFLFRALRDSSDPQSRITFAENILVLRRALTYRTAIELDMSYNDWVEQEFPDAIGQDEFDKLKAEAKKKSLNDLLSEFGYSPIRRVLPILARESGM